MSTTTIAVIVVAAVGLLLLAAALVWLAQRTRKHQRHNEAENIRGEAAEETLRVKQREALADETAAKARAAQAEADVKAAQATGLQQQAAAHRSEAATSRDHLNEQWIGQKNWIRPPRQIKHRAPRTKSRRPFNHLRSSPQPAFIPTAIDFAASPVDDGSG
jgi:hypothetical protein